MRLGLITILTAIAAAVLVSACTATTHRPAASGGVSRFGTSSASSSSTSAPQSPPSRQIVYFADVWGPDLVLVAVGPGPDGGSRPRLLATTVDGRRFREIGPRTRVGDYPDSVFFLDREHGWFTTFSGGGGRETLYRTRNGGRTWKAFSIPPHSMAGGSTDAVQFTTAQDGWLVDVQPTGPGETLYRSTDGGRNWRPVSTLNTSGSDTSQLPRIGLVRFESGNQRGWLGGGPPYSAGLYVTRDQARSWRSADIPGPRDGAFALPSLFGNTVLEPVTRCSDRRTELDLYVSTDNGEHWTARPPGSTAAGQPSSSCNQIATDFPSPNVGWAATISRKHVVIIRTDDQGRHWQPITIPELLTRYTPSISAADGTHAWLQVAGIDVHGTRLYITGDSGRTWQRIDQLASR